MWWLVQDVHSALLRFQTRLICAPVGAVWSLPSLLCLETGAFLRWRCVNVFTLCLHDQTMQSHTHTSIAIARAAVTKVENESMPIGTGKSARLTMIEKQGQMYTVDMVGLAQRRAAKG